MKITGENVVPHPVETVWSAVLDPQVLVRAIPGCEALDTIGPDAYSMTVTAGVAAIKGTYTGRCELSDLRQHESLLMSLSGSGVPGTVDAKVHVTFAATDDGGTRISYEADATVGGMVGGVGQRMLSAVSKRMAGEFFGAIGRLIDNGPVGARPDPAGAVAEPPADTTGRVGAPDTGAGPPQSVVRAARTGPRDGTEMLRGVAIGAALVALGVVLGARIGR